MSTASSHRRDFRPGDVRHALADIDKARTRLGYAPSHRLGDGLAEAMDWSVDDMGGVHARSLINPGREARFPVPGDGSTIHHAHSMTTSRCQ